VEKPLTDRQVQAAAPSDLAAGFVAVLVAPALAAESADELPDSPDEEAPADPEPLWDSLPDPPESLRDALSAPRREPFLESFLESLR
jgi:hypothetical protein